MPTKRIQGNAKDSGSDRAAQTLTSSAFAAAVVVNSFTGGKHDAIRIFATLKEQAAVLRRGDMSQVEDMLVNQAVSLQSMFVDFALRCKNNSEIDIVQRLGQLALKAQANCRATLQTLAEIKNPRQVAFVKQANIAETQQVNNGSTVPARVEKKKSKPIKLLAEDPDGSSFMDARTTPQASEANSFMGAMGGLDRTNHPTRKGHHFS